MAAVNRFDDILISSKYDSIEAVTTEFLGIRSPKGEASKTQKRSEEHESEFEDIFLKNGFRKVTDTTGFKTKEIDRYFMNPRPATRNRYLIQVNVSRKCLYYHRPHSQHPADFVIIRLVPVNEHESMMTFCGVNVKSNSGKKPTARRKATTPRRNTETVHQKKVIFRCNDTPLLWRESIFTVASTVDHTLLLWGEAQPDDYTFDKSCKRLQLSPALSAVSTMTSRPRPNYDIIINVSEYENNKEVFINHFKDKMRASLFQEPR